MGHPKKAKNVFKGLLERNFDNENERTNNIFRKTRPVKLLNLGENVCFFNSIIQILFPITPFQNKILLQDNTNNDVTLAFKDLFQEMLETKSEIRTSVFLQRINILTYQHGSQFDAHECLLFILNEIYPDIDDSCIFKIRLKTTVTCNKSTCNHNTERNSSNSAMTLYITDRSKNWTVTELLNNYLALVHLTGYKCDSCSDINTCYELNSVTDFKHVLVFQLSSFEFLNEVMTKVGYNINIEESLVINGPSLKLHSVIFHHGLNAQNGYYTCSVKRGNEGIITLINLV